MGLRLLTRVKGRLLRGRRARRPPELIFTLPIVKTRLRFSFWFFAAAALLLLLDRHALLWYFVMPVAIHETGHLLAILICSVRVREIFFTPVSIRMETRHTGNLSYRREITVAFGGAALNLLAALAIYLFAFASMRNMLLMASNLAVAMISLLPIGSLDGGQILRAICARRAGPDFARKVSLAVSFIALVPLSAAAGFFVLRGATNFTPLILCVYLIVTVIVSD